MQSVRTLTDGLIDYAGLFPPAGLEMRNAVANYASYLAGPDSTMLGRFIIPATRLSELSSMTGSLPERDAAIPWKLSVLIGDQVRDEIEKVREFRAQGGNAVVDTLEVKAASTERVQAVSEAVPDDCRVFVELPVTDLNHRVLDKIRKSGFSAKIRTGGIEQASFPTSGQVIQFLGACRERSIAFKATAGLHHIVCGSYPLTYEAAAERGEMFGFLNVFLAAAFMFCGASPEEGEAILRERSLKAFQFRADSIAWNGRNLSVQQIAEGRVQFAVSFGSCSFTEPVEELKKMLANQGLQQSA